MALSFSCNRIRLTSYVTSAWMILCKLLAFICAIFPNTNLVEIILPQSLGRFGAVVYGRFFMVNWMDSIIERIRSTGIVKREYIRSVFAKLTFQNL